MAFVDLHGGTSGGVQGHLDVTHRRFEGVLSSLLPNGAAWDPEDPVRQRLVAAMGTELSRVDVRADELARELDPHTTFALIGDWELELGLPECVAPTTLEARRAAVLAKLLAEPGHGQGPLWWKSALEALGYPPEYFLHGQDVLDCKDDCIDDCKDEQWMFVWGIYVWTGIDDALLQCFVAHNALLGSLALPHFMWQPIVVVDDPHNLYGVAVTSKGFVAAVGAGGYNLHAAADYDDADGSGWTPGVQQDEDLLAVTDVGHVFVACGVNPVNFLRSTNHGETWTTVANPTEEMYAISAGIGAGVALAAGENGVVWRSFNYGLTWELATAIAGAPNVQGLTRSGDGVSVQGVVAVAANGHVYRTPNSGTAWTDVHNAGSPLYGVGAWRLVVVAVGDGGIIVRSTDGGVTFAAVTSPTTANLRGVVGTPAGRWTAVGLGGVILQSQDDGATWKVQPSPTTDNLYAVTRHVPTDRAIIVGQNIRIIVE